MIAVTRRALIRARPPLLALDLLPARRDPVRPPTVVEAALVVLARDAHIEISTTNAPDTA
jgi:hypothetical protein